MKFYRLLFCILFSASFHLQAQSEDILILGIEVEGNQRITDQDVQRNARLYKGMTLKGNEFQQAIKRLWNLKRFGNIQINLLEETEEGVYLQIYVEEYPILGEVSYEGNKKKSKRALNEELNLNAGQILSDYAIFEAMQTIQSLYAEKHYHNIEIDTVFSPGELEYSQNLKFIITEGRKTKIKKIDFIGNAVYSDWKLSGKFKENKAKTWYFPWRGAWKEDQFDADKDLLIKFYKDNGYRDFYIVNESVDLNEKGNGYEITFEVYEGPQYKVRNFTWDGNFVHSNEELEARLGFEKGDIFREENFNMAVSERVSPLYSDKGYFYFQINPIFTPVDEDSLDIHFEITENQIVHVRKIHIKGNQRTHENVIRRELRVYPGDLFSRKKLMDSYRDVFMLNFFENVIPDVIPVSDNEIDIQLEVFEKSTGQANFSMGYNGVYGFTGGGGFEFPNFRGRGQTLSISYQRGLNANSGASSGTGQFYNPSYTSQNTAAYQSFSISFTEPWLFDTPNMVGGSYYYTERGQGQGSYLPFDIKQHGGSLRWGRRFKWPDFFFRGSWMFRFGNKSYLSDMPIPLSSLSYYLGNDVQHMVALDTTYNYPDGNVVSGTLPESGIKSSGISLTQIITRDSRNHPEFPTSGSKSIWTSTLSGSFLGGDENYHKHILDFNWFIPLHKRVTISQIFKGGMLKQLPSSKKYSIRTPNESFIIGGTGFQYGEMLRGYPDPSSGGNNVIGNYMMKYSMELRLSLSENPALYTLAFAEMGNAWLESNLLDPFDMKRSAGVGVRVFIPMLGMLGYDIGYGFDEWGTNEPFGWKHHLIFGMPF